LPIASKRHAHANTLESTKPPAAHSPQQAVSSEQPAAKTKNQTKAHMNIFFFALICLTNTNTNESIPRHLLMNEGRQTTD
jgi:hypothetical protein